MNLQNEVRRTCRFFSAIIALTFAQACQIHEAENFPDQNPNIILIVADDLGFSDLGAFGSEIETDTLDQLAFEGVRFEQMYATPACSPTRAQLLSGADNHLAGVGNMFELLQDYQLGQPGYEGYLHRRVHWLPEVLSQNGYFTAMTGKWHLGTSAEVSPNKRGFERSFALLSGSSNHFSNHLGSNRRTRATHRSDGTISPRPTGPYSSDYYTDLMLDFLNSEANRSRPFFAYLAFTAPHFPVQAPDGYIQKYAGVYEDGYEAIRQSRLARMSELGFFSDALLSSVPSAPSAEAWERLSSEEQAIEARRMQVYAAMIDNLDDNVGRIVDALERDGRLQNTIIIFLSDNGADAKTLTRHPLFSPRREAADNALSNIGTTTSYEAIGPNWATVSNSPLNGYKQFTHEGGIRVPAFIWWGDEVSMEAHRRGSIDERIVSVKDVTASILELAGIEVAELNQRYPDKHQIQGMGLMRSKIEDPTFERTLGWEHRNRYALRSGKWKLVRIPNRQGEASWQLYDLEADLAETKDVSQEHPETMERLALLWEQYLNANNVVTPAGNHVEVMPEHMFNTEVKDE